MIADGIKVAPDEMLKRISCKRPVKHCSIDPLFHRSNYNEHTVLMRESPTVV